MLAPLLVSYCTDNLVCPLILSTIFGTHCVSAIVSVAILLSFYEGRYTKIETIRNDQIIQIDSKQILDQIGYYDGHEPSARIRSLVNDYLDNYHNFIESMCSYTFRNIESVQGDRVYLGDTAILESKIIARLCKQCYKVAVFVVTIGSYLEEMVSYLAENGLVLQATVLDAVGSGAAEQMAALIEERIGNIVSSQGQNISRRFSPGYCDWDINQQEVIFNILHDDTAGIRLTEEYLMIPCKSISGIIGIGTSKIENYNPCQTCDKHDCVGRR